MGAVFLSSIAVLLEVSRLCCGFWSDNCSTLCLYHNIISFNIFAFDLYLSAVSLILNLRKVPIRGSLLIPLPVSQDYNPKFRFFSLMRDQRNVWIFFILLRGNIGD